MKVLVVDERVDRGAVTAVRALAAAGWTVGSASWAPGLAAQSKASSAWHRVAHTADGDDAFLESLNDVVVHEGYEAAFVTWERGVRAVSERRAELDFPVGYGDHDGLLLAMDKEQLPAAAHRAGIGTPRTVRADERTLGEWSGPVVIKNAWAADINFRGKAFDDLDEALELARHLDATGGRAIAQEKVAGSLAAITLVAGPDGIVTIGQQRAELVWPVPIGSTARGVSVPLDPALVARVETLLENLKWQGLAHLEFLVQPDGEFLLIDFNPRFYGSMALAIRSGVNHPDAWARIATGRPVPYTVGRPGARYQWLSRDVRASTAAPDRLAETARCLAAAPFAEHSVFSWRDPTLAARFFGQQAARSLRRRLPGSSDEAQAVVEANARLNGVDLTPRVRRLLRTRPVLPAPARRAEQALVDSGRLGLERSYLVPLARARRELLGERGSTGSRPELLLRVEHGPGADAESVERVHGVLRDAGAAHVVAVSPGSPVARRLADLAAADPALLTVAARGRGLGEGRSAAAVATDLDRDLAAFAELGIEPQICIPAADRFGEDEWALLAERFRIVTSGPGNVANVGFHGGPQWWGPAVHLPFDAGLYGSPVQVLPALERLVEARVSTWVQVVLTVGDGGDDQLRSFLARHAGDVRPWPAFLDRIERCPVAG